MLSLVRREHLAQGTVTLEALHGDGSDRQFFRIRRHGKSNLLAVLPSPTLPRALAEARASYLIGKHLRAQGVPVPKIFCFEEKTGALVLEDLGDLLLFDVLREESGPQEKVAWYQQAIEALVLLQLQGCRGFEADYCWDTARYDRQLMLERESHYFLGAFCRDYLGLLDETADLCEEFEQLASRAAREPAHFLLHRDFQSRNLMIHQGELKIIDYQGARFGPLGYDLASLLIDPYVGLDLELQEELIDFYVEVLNRRLPVDGERFRSGYYFLRLQRNLQIIGAYAFLSHRKKKSFFRPFLRPALEALHVHLQHEKGSAFPCLRLLAQKCTAILSGSPAPETNSPGE